MRKLLFLLTLLALPLPAIDWTVNAPEVVSLTKRNDQNRVTLVVRVNFRGDAGQVHPRDYEVSGADALVILRRRVYEDRATLQAAEGIANGAITPLAPTPLDQAIADYQLAIRKLRALSELQTLLGLADGANIGSSNVTVSAARVSLRAAASTNLSTVNAIHLALESFPQ